MELISNKRAKKNWTGNKLKEAEKIDIQDKFKKMLERDWKAEENNKQTEALQMRRAIPEIGFKLPNHKRLAIQTTLQYKQTVTKGVLVCNWSNRTITMVPSTRDGKINEFFLIELFMIFFLYLNQTFKQSNKSI